MVAEGWLESPRRSDGGSLYHRFHPTLVPLHQAPVDSNSNGLCDCLRGEFPGLCTIRQNSLMVSVVSFHLMRNQKYKLECTGCCLLKRPKVNFL